MTDVASSIVQEGETNYTTHLQSDQLCFAMYCKTNFDEGMGDKGAAVGQRWVKIRGLSAVPYTTCHEGPWRKGGLYGTGI
jgi:hypothetical protein